MTECLTRIKQKMNELNTIPQHAMLNTIRVCCKDSDIQTPITPTFLPTHNCLN